MSNWALVLSLILAAGIAAWIPLPRWRSIVTGSLFISACAVASWASVAVIVTTTSSDTIIGSVSLLPPLHLVMSPLRALFIVICCVVLAATTPSALRDAEAMSPRAAAFFLNLLILLFAAMLAVFVSGDIVGFLFSWGIAALAIWALIIFDGSNDPAAVKAGYLTLALSEAGTLAGMAGLFLMASAAGGSTFESLAASTGAMSTAFASICFALTFFGFGTKAGVVPMNSWVPEAYATAPRSVTPVLSGATPMLGVFAMIIIDGPIARSHLTLALVMLVVGAGTALIGIVYALVERDLRRVLAQSSIENFGIVIAALGAGFAFISLGLPVLGGIALIAALYHVLNHSMYKTLLFLGAAAVDDSVGSLALDRLGGLARRLPMLGILFLAGTMAIAALPPFNGFVSEWLVLESLLRVVETSSILVRMTFALSAAALALTAGLALTCFVMVFASTFLGIPRTADVVKARPASLTTLAPMGCLAFLSLALGVLSVIVIPLLGDIVNSFAAVQAAPSLVPAFFQWSPTAMQGVDADLVGALTPNGARLGETLLPVRGLVVLHSGGADTPVIFAMSTAWTFLVLSVLVVGTWFVFRVLRRRDIKLRRPWSGGLYQLHANMTYTASAFASPVRVLFDRLLQPTVAEHTVDQGAFSRSIHRRSETVHVVDRLTLRPVVKLLQQFASLLAKMHHGSVTGYAIYVLISLVAALLAGWLSL